LLGHGHGDHFSGARYFQDRYGTKVGAGPGDWDLINPPGAPADQASQNARPKQDLTLEEGKPIVLGDQTVQVLRIPGHTPGSLAFVFTVSDNGQRHTAGIFGGTILDQGRITTDGLKQYLRSIDHYLEFAKKMNVDVEIQNHALFDDLPGRLARLKTRKSGEPNPFTMSASKYAALWNITSECIQAEIARRESGLAR
jgi:metallo-beta-lactamase class B